MAECCCERRLHLRLQTDQTWMQMLAENVETNMNRYRLHQLLELNNLDAEQSCLK